MRGSEILREKNEFEALLVRNEKKRVAMSSNYINLTISEQKSEGMDPKIAERIEELKHDLKKRQSAPWKPSPALCQKFGVLDPYQYKPFQKEEKAKPPKKEFVAGPTTMLGKATTETVKKILAKNDGNDFFKQVQASFQEELRAPPLEKVQDVPQKEAKEQSKDTSTEKAKGEEAAKPEGEEVVEKQQLIVSMETRPEMSLFQSIFDD